jgi:hypothetical protein
MSRQPASLSLDLDDKWAYLRTHGDAEWKRYPSYLPAVMPRILDFLAERELPMTVFVVGRDAERRENRACLEQIAAAGHELGNHSMNHYPWLQTLPADEIAHEVVEAELAIESATGARTRGFRAPGFSGSSEVRRVLASRGYAYDASAFPTFLGPLARTYCRLTSAIQRRSGDPRDKLFGSWREGLAPLKPHVLQGTCEGLVEIPVTTMPLLRLPFHMTYLLFLRQKLGPLWRAYFRLALTLCRMRGVAPSMLLHPLDFLGSEDEPELSFFPGMKLARADKLAVVDEALQLISARWHIVALCEAAAAVPVHRPVESCSVPRTEVAPETAAV